MSEPKKENLLGKIPEAFVIVMLAGLLGWQETKTATQKDVSAMKVDLKDLRDDFDEMHPRTK